MTAEIMFYAEMLIAGMILGAVFFGGLWMTVQSASKVKRPGLLFVASVVVRTTVVLAGIWSIGGGDAAAMATCLFGFVAFRLLATHGTAVFGKSFGVKVSE